MVPSARKMSPRLPERALRSENAPDAIRLQRGSNKHGTWSGRAGCSPGAPYGAPGSARVRLKSSQGGVRVLRLLPAVNPPRPRGERARERPAGDGWVRAGGEGTELLVPPQRSTQPPGGSRVRCGTKQWREEGRKTCRCGRNKCGSSGIFPRREAGQSRIDDLKSGSGVTAPHSERHRGRRSF